MARLTPDQLHRAQEIATAGLAFVKERNAALPTALISYLWFDGSSDDVATALATYQNTDGGFGNRLEPDIHAPESNPFAARIAMQYLCAIQTFATQNIRAGLKDWLVANQHIDGDWHFSDETKAGFLQPWFGGWTFPSLNPACCVAGFANSLDLATPSMMERTAALFEQQASIEGARTGEFYNLLPYVEYSLGVTLSSDYLDAIAANIVAMSQAGSFSDAEHFFTLALGGAPALSARIPDELFTGAIDRMLQEPLDDGGWPTPYDDAWRVWATAGNLMTLARLKSS